MICYAGHGRSENRATFVGKSLNSTDRLARQAHKVGVLILPGRVLTGSGEVRNIFPHLDETQLNELRQMLLVDEPTSLGGNIHQRPAQVDGIQAKLGEWIGRVFHLLIML